MSRPIAVAALVLCTVGALGAGAAARAGREQAQPASAVETRERAWRANNIGVAHLEQFDFEAASTSFREALAADPQLALARLNLGIARFYAGDLDGARTELDAARTSLPARPHPDYVLGLVARAENRTADALAAFERVRAIDPTDVGTAINLGQVHLQERRYDEAVARFKEAIAVEPYNATAAYGLATALTRSRADGGEAATERFQTLRTSEYAVTYSQNYLEQGRYAAGIASSGAEAALVDTAVPDVRVGDAETTIEEVPEATAVAMAQQPRSLTLADLDGDGDLDLVEAGGEGLRVIRNDGRGSFGEGMAAAGDASPGPARAALAGDYDNDGAVDLVVLRERGLALLHRTGPDTWADVTASAGLSALAGTFSTVAWVDVDHDGDLDLALGGTGARLLRNNGDGTFADVTSAAHLPTAGTISAIVPSDYDDRRDVDLLLVSPDAEPALFTNRRDGSFADVAGDVGLRIGGGAVMAAAADFNKDGSTDFAFARESGPARLAISDGRGRFAVSDAPAETAGARQLVPLDYDNDGLVDLLAVTPAGLRLWRSTGAAWVDVSAAAGLGSSRADAAANRLVGAADIDADGDTDLVVRDGRSRTVLFIDNRAGHAALTVALQGRVSNRSGAGVKVEMRAGSLRGRQETYIASPAPAPADIVFGLGDRQAADAVRVLWPSGILQAETGIGDAGGPLVGRAALEELDRKPSSCPYLYTWNGTRFEFVTDFLGGGEMGYWLGPDLRNSPIPSEYVRIPPGSLVPRDGRLELRVTNELEEALFLDRLQLVAVDHPGGLSVFPNAGLREGPEPFELYRTRAHQPLIAATDSHGHDVTERLAAIDRAFVDDFALEPIRGYAETHTLTLTLPSSSGRRLLLLNGWTDYAFSRDNVAAHQQDLSLIPPSLQTPDGRGGWRTLVANLGFPAGRPQTVTLDLTGQLPDGPATVRIVTNMRIYWDQIVATESEPAVDVTLTRLEAATADLRWRGFSAEVSPTGREPWTYDYDTVSPDSPWKLLPGRYTREGDVRPLLGEVDDMFVVSRPGDEVALTFDATALPPLAAGWTRTYLLYGDGFSKEMDLHSSSPDVLDPLPFHGMSSYPYPDSDAYPSTPAHRDYLERYNTRIVARPLPPLELVGTGSR